MRIKKGMLYRIGILTAISGVLAGVGSLFAQTAGGGSDEDEYVPGTSTIEEAGILERMERELRTEFTPTAPTEKDGGPAKRSDARAKKKIHEYRVTLGLQDSSSVSGNLTLVQQALEIRDQAETLHRIPLRDVQSLEFLDWQRLRSAHATKERPGREYLAPTACRVVKKDGDEIRGRCDVNDFLQLNLRTPDSFGRYRIYYTRDASDAKKTEAAAEKPAPETPETTQPASEQPAADQPETASPVGDTPPATVVTRLSFVGSAEASAAENDSTNGEQETASAPPR